MKILAALIASLALAGTAILAHGTNEHVRGVVSTLSPQSITVETTVKTTRTLKITDKTTFERAGKAARLTDLKVGDRVVVDVPAKSTEALLIQIGTASAQAPKAAASTSKPAK